MAVKVLGRDLQPGDRVVDGAFFGLTVLLVECPHFVKFNEGGATRVGEKSIWLVERPPSRDEVIRDIALALRAAETD